MLRIILIPINIISRQRHDVSTHKAVLTKSLEGLTSVFGMRTGVPLPLWSPT